MKRNMLVSLAFATVLFALPALSHAQLNAVVCNLRTGSCTPNITGVTVTTLAQQHFPAGTACATAGTWYGLVITVDLKPAFGKQTAFFTVEYEGTPSLWTVDIGDAATDDGYGGADVTDPSAAAEVQVVNQLLSVFDFNRGIAVEDLLSQQLALTNGSLKFGVADQTLAVGQPRTILATPGTKALYQIPDPLAQPLGTGYQIYGGFNRVVNLNNHPERVGCGAKYVTIWTGTNPPGV